MSDLIFTRPSPRTKATLKWLMEEYPDLITVPNANELHYSRATLLQKLSDDKHSFNMTAFERGLKHAGMKCVQSTHKAYVKVWRNAAPAAAPAALAAALPNILDQ